MEILAHRGLWQSSAEKNTIAAFKSALGLGFGIETDIRDFCSTLVISHDIPTQQSLKLSDFLDIYKSYSINSCLALNIKSCGLAEELSKFIKSYAIKNYFFFDMAVPDALSYFKNDLTAFVRISEFEHSNALIEARAAGIWLDEFMDGSTIIETNAIKYANSGKSVAIVSPELHKRQHENAWQLYKTNQIHKLNNAYICTDFPREAKEFFNVCGE